MISSLLAMTLAAAAPGPSADAIARARKAYSACLSGFMKKSLKDGVEDAAFESGLAPACATQEQAFRATVIAADTAAGIKRADADENASFEVDDMVANTVETFRSHRDAGKPPVEQAAAEAPAPAEAATVTPASAENPSPN